MSFDPQNPRGASRPPTPSPAPVPSGPPPPIKGPSYIPPQPQRTGIDPRYIAIAAVAILVLLAVLMLIFLFGGFSGGSGKTPRPTTTLRPSTAPTAAGSPSSSSVPNTAQPSSSAAAPTTPPPPGTPSSAYDALVGHVPDSLRGTCTSGGSADGAATVSATCTSSDGITVVYAEYNSLEDMSATYNDAFAAQQIDADSGSCEDHSTWPAEGSYEVDGAPAGRRLCADQNALPTITWTDERVLILSTATGSDPVRLVDFWANEAGPVK